MSERLEIEFEFVAKTQFLYADIKSLLRKPLHGKIYKAWLQTFQHFKFVFNKSRFKGIESLPQTQILYSSYVCNLMMEAKDISILDDLI